MKRKLILTELDLQCLLVTLRNHDLSTLASQLPAYVVDPAEDGPEIDILSVDRSISC
jgi:hypothetical protein